VITRVGVLLAVATLLAGLFIGYLWWGRGSPPPQRELAEELKARLAEQAQRADELQRKVTDLEAEFRAAAEGLQREREAREQLEEILSKGKK
jgi:hypothetical protein